MNINNCTEERASKITLKDISLLLIIHKMYTNKMRGILIVSTVWHT